MEILLGYKSALHSFGASPKSCKGQGTTAEIWLPAITTTVTAPAAFASQGAVASDGSITRPLTILVVDDDALVLQNTAAMLEDLGHRALEAHSGQEALDYLGQGRAVDLVVTDQAMPGLTGLQLAAAIGMRWPHLPVILASGYTEMATEVGSNLLRLDKPFRQDDLARAVSQSIGNQAGGRVVRFRARLSGDQARQEL
jgi:CheY-like chemotaxis protein